MDKWRKKKVAIYLRRSKGEGGATQSQLNRILKEIKALEKAGKIAKVDMNIVGRDITKQERFNAQRDLSKKGDIFNEGDGQSAFDSARERAVLNEMLRRMRAGQYEAIIAESLDRYSRDPLDFGTVALDDWRKNGKIFWGLKDNRGYGDGDPLSEPIITTSLMWGGEGKKSESRKSINALEVKLDLAYISSRLKADLLGSGTKNAGINYRRFWDLAKAYGENDKGRLNSPSAVGKEFKRDHTWASNNYEMFKQWDSFVYPDGESALTKWFNAVDALNAFIANEPSPQMRTNFKSTRVKQLLKTANGFINYPAGVNPSAKFPTASKQFILFPDPTNFDFEVLAEEKDPNRIEGWSVQRLPVQDYQPLMKYQTQFRGKGGMGKRLV